jgi:hypothetical protein
VDGKQQLSSLICPISLLMQYLVVDIVAVQRIGGLREGCSDQTVHLHAVFADYLEGDKGLTKFLLRRGRGYNQFQTLVQSGQIVVSNNANGTKYTKWVVKAGTRIPPEWFSNVPQEPVPRLGQFNWDKLGLNIHVSHKMKQKQSSKDAAKLMNLPIAEQFNCIESLYCNVERMQRKVDEISDGQPRKLAKHNGMTWFTR